MRQVEIAKSVVFIVPGRALSEWGPLLARQDGVQGVSRVDPEFGERFAQVPFDRPWTEEQHGADLPVGTAVTGEPGDLFFLRRKLVARLAAALAQFLARCGQFATCPLGERLHSDRGEHVVGRSQLLARVDATPLAAQPLAVEQMRAGEFGAEACAPETFDRLAVELIRVGG